jgi:hypothetical protein
MDKKRGITGEQILDFYKNISLEETGFPPGIRAMNPYADNTTVRRNLEAFYSRFYNDSFQRRMILGINPGRLGAGVTGIMFTDTIRLNEKCGIPFSDFKSYEPSSEFFYLMIDRYGGVKEFYSKFYIGAVSPLGFVIRKNDKEVNYNYYDSKTFQKLITPFILKTLKKQLEFNIFRDVCFCLGTGKNYTFLNELNARYKFFGTIIPLEHPRYIMQYKRKSMNKYIDKYMLYLNHRT